MDRTTDTTGANDRPKDPPNGRTGAGSPDDRARPEQAAEREADKVRETSAVEEGDREAEGHPS